ncbi:MAG: hypothetical protein JNM84_23710, partial [Planctomycetes bacterium]|nr:hypothetical protein [Planctomycetota bacterium]
MQAASFVPLATTELDAMPNPTPSKHDDLFQREKEVRAKAGPEPEESRRLARDLADAFRARLDAEPGNASLAAALLRCLRRAEAPWIECAAECELLRARFPQHEMVLSAADFLLLDQVNEDLAA